MYGHRVVVAVAAGIVVATLASKADAFGGLAGLSRISRMNRNLSKVNKMKRRLNQIKKYHRLFGNLKHGLKGLRPDLQRKLFRKKGLAGLLDRTMKVKRAFRTGMVNELGSSSKARFIKKLLRSKKMVSALKRKDFRSLFAEANVKMPPSVAALVSGKGNLGQALVGTAMSKYAKGASSEFTGRLNVGAAMGSLLKNNKRFGGIFQEAMERSDGRFKTMFNSLSGLAKRRFLMKVSGKNEILNKLKGREYSTVFSSLGMKVPKVPEEEQPEYGDEYPEASVPPPAPGAAGLTGEGGYDSGGAGDGGYDSGDAGDEGYGSDAGYDGADDGGDTEEGEVGFD